jgi:hypothetical protein
VNYNRTSTVEWFAVVGEVLPFYNIEEIFNMDDSSIDL